MFNSMIDIVLAGCAILLFLALRKEQKKVRILSHFVSGTAREVELLFESTKDHSTNLHVSEKKASGLRFLLCQIWWELKRDRYLFHKNPNSCEGGFPQLYLELHKHAAAEILELQKSLHQQEQKAKN
jgi:hypothetical protein